MKPYAGFEAKAATNGYPMLPAGPYIGVIKAAKVDGAEPDETLVLRLEITEGEHANYYTNRYQHDKDAGGQYEPKYKGDLRLRVPNPDNQNDAWPETTKKRFEDAIYQIEQSNPGYHWNWDERGLVGKPVAFSVQEGSYNGNPYTSIARLESIQNVRDGKIKVMKPRKPRGDAADTSSAVPAGFTAVENDDIPF